MLYKIMLILVVFWGCTKHDDNPDPAPIDFYEALQEKADFYIAGADWDKVFKNRCDKWTFYNLACAGGGPCDIDKFEWRPGEWHRDVNGHPCFVGGQDVGSKSEVSIDGFLTLPLALAKLPWERANKMINDLITYGEANDWNMGEGPRELVNISHIKHLYYDMRDKYSWGLTYDSRSIPDGFRGHLILMYVWDRALIKGYINDLELAALKYLVEGNPENPLYQCLYTRFKNEQFPEFLMKYNPNFPDREIPYEAGIYGWGSAPAVVYFLGINECLQRGL